MDALVPIAPTPPAPTGSAPGQAASTAREGADFATMLAEATAEPMADEPGGTAATEAEGETFSLPPELGLPLLTAAAAPPLAEAPGHAPAAVTTTPSTEAVVRLPGLVVPAAEPALPSAAPASLPAPAPSDPGVLPGPSSPSAAAVTEAAPVRGAAVQPGSASPPPGAAAPAPQGDAPAQTPAQPAPPAASQAGPVQRARFAEVGATAASPHLLAGAAGASPPRSAVAMRATPIADGSHAEAPSSRGAVADVPVTSTGAGATISLAQSLLREEQAAEPQPRFQPVIAAHEASAATGDAPSHAPAMANPPAAVTSAGGPQAGGMQAVHVAPASPPSRPAAPILPLAQQVAPFAASLVLGPDSQVSLTLEPAELGRVDVSIIQDGVQTSVRILAERPETLALLQRDQRELERALTAAGLGSQDGGPSLSFGLGSEASSHGDRRERVPREMWHGETPASPLPAAASPATGARRGLIDLAI